VKHERSRGIGGETPLQLEPQAEGLGRYAASDSFFFLDGQEIIDRNVSHRFDFTVRPVNLDQIYFVPLS
jgi:hypothetical protein